MQTRVDSLGREQVLGSSGSGGFSGEGSMTTQRVLVVDYDPSMRNLLREILGDIADRIDVAGGLREARQYLENARYNLSLSELLLPEGSGLELVRLIGDKYPELPVILMTSFPTSDVRSRAARAGAHALLEKPFSNQAARSICKRFLAPCR